MKYEIIKRRIAIDVGATILRGGDMGGGIRAYEAAITAVFDSIAERRPYKESIGALADKVVTIINNWDVRQVGRLRELFPDSFPKSLSKGQLFADYDEQGNWAITN